MPGNVTPGIVVFAEFLKCQRFISINHSQVCGSSQPYSCSLFCSIPKSTWIFRLGLSHYVAFSLSLRHGRSYMSIAECARLRLSFSSRIFQSLSKLRSCPSRYGKRLTGVRRILLFLCDPVGIRTQDPQLRRLLLYPAERGVTLLKINQLRMLLC